MATMTAGYNMMGTEAAQPRSHRKSTAERNRELFDVQTRARRGPTPEVFFAKHLDNSRIVKMDDPVRRREMRIFSIVMTMLFALGMVYVYQHFSSIEIGYSVEAQKLQVDHLREENRQLRLNEAQLTEPIRIDRIAKQLGLDEPQPGQVIRTEGLSGADANGAAYASLRVPVSGVQ
jgi:cell division protein FtsL